jgi:hypothetical protein
MCIGCRPALQSNLEPCAFVFNASQSAEPPPKKSLVECFQDVMASRDHGILPAVLGLFYARMEGEQNSTSTGFM